MLFYKKLLETVYHQNGDVRSSGDKGPENKQGCTTEKEQGEDSCPRPAWRMKSEGSRGYSAKQSKTKMHLNIRNI